MGTPLPTLDRQLQSVDDYVFERGEFLYVYARQVPRKTGWLLVLRNIYYPRQDVVVGHPIDESDAERRGLKASSLFNCHFQTVTDFDPDGPATHKFRPFPVVEGVSHNLVQVVVPTSRGYVACVKNTALDLYHDVGPWRETPEEAQSDLAARGSFYFPPESPSSVRPGERSFTQPSSPKG